MEKILRKSHFVSSFGGDQPGDCTSFIKFPFEKGDLGGFRQDCRHKPSLSPPYERGGSYLRISSYPIDGIIIGWLKSGVKHIFGISEKVRKSLKPRPNDTLSLTESTPVCRRQGGHKEGFV